MHHRIGRASVPVGHRDEPQDVSAIRIHRIARRHRRSGGEFPVRRPLRSLSAAEASPCDVRPSGRSSDPSGDPLASRDVHGNHVHRDIRGHHGPHPFRTAEDGHRGRRHDHGGRGHRRRPRHNCPRHRHGHHRGQREGGGRKFGQLARHRQGRGKRLWSLAGWNCHWHSACAEDFMAFEVLSQSGCNSDPRLRSFAGDCRAVRVDGADAHHRRIRDGACAFPHRPQASYPGEPSERLYLPCPCVLLRNGHDG